MRKKGYLRSILLTIITEILVICCLFSTNVIAGETREDSDYLENNNTISILGTSGDSDSTSDLSEISKQRESLKGYWKGFYFAGQGKTALNLKIASLNEDGGVTANFCFSEHEDNPGVPSGEYTMKGTYDFNSHHLYLEGIEWLEHPSGYVFVDINSSVDESSESMTGSTSGYDGLTLSKYSGLTEEDLTKDTDGDALLDIYELEGVDVDEDGIVDVHIEKMGSDIKKPDIFVEIDYMVEPKETKFLWFTIKNEQKYGPSEKSMKMVYEVFKEHSINIHLDYGEDATDFVTGNKWGDLSGSNSIAFQNDLQLGNNCTNWESLAKGNIAKERLKVFRHAMFINTYDGGTSSGIANGIPGQYFIVANQEWVRNTGDKGVAGTFMHELGHTLGLTHGGYDENGQMNHINDKPNYLSIMNYLFQTTGLVGTNKINYSEYLLPTLQEDSLDEATGIDSGEITKYTNLGTRLSGYDKSIKNIAGSSIDFNQNGTIDPTAYKHDLNNDGIFTPLSSSVDWDKIQYKAGEIGETTNSAGKENSFMSTNEELMRELTLEDALEKKVLANDSKCAAEAVGPFTFVEGVENQYLHVHIMNLGSEAAEYYVYSPSSAINESLYETVHVSGIEEEIKYTDIGIPIKSSAGCGDYFVKLTTTDSDNGNTVYEIPISVYSPSADELKDLEKGIQSGDISVSDEVKDEYQHIFDVNSNSDNSNDNDRNALNNQYVIAASAGDGGKISPSGRVFVEEGEDMTFTITPDVRYRIFKVEVDGVSVGEVSTYTFKNVTGEHTIKANFLGKNYSIDTFNVGSDKFTIIYQNSVSSNGTKHYQKGRGSNTKKKSYDVDIMILRNNVDVPDAEYKTVFKKNKKTGNGYFKIAFKGKSYKAVKKTLKKKKYTFTIK